MANLNEILKLLERHELDLQRSHDAGDVGSRMVPYFRFSETLFKNPVIIEAAKTVFPALNPAAARSVAKAKENLLDEARQQIGGLLQMCIRDGYLDLSNKVLVDRKPSTMANYSYQDLFRCILAQTTTHMPPMDTIAAYKMIADENQTQMPFLDFEQILASTTDVLGRTHLQMSHEKRLTRYREILNWIRDRHLKIEVAESVVSSLSHESALNVLKGINAYYSSARSGFVEGIPDHPERFLSAEHMDYPRLQRECLEMIGSLRAIFSTRLSASSTMLRYASFADKFDKSGLLAALRSVGSRELEKVCQEHFDRYLFTNGFFPITHAQAGGGNWDSLSQDQKNELLMAAELSSNIAPPLLTEIKQVLNLTDGDYAVDQKRLLAVYEQAKAQVLSYRSHISAACHGGLLETFVVIFYNGTQRWSVITDENAEVKCLPVYVGDRPPSRASGTIQIS